MAAKGQSDIDRLMDKYTQRRRAECGPPMELNGPARNELQSEVARQYGGKLEASPNAGGNYASLLAGREGLGRLGHKLVTWLGFAGAACLALIVAFIAANHRTAEEPAAKTSSDFLQVAQADPKAIAAAQEPAAPGSPGAGTSGAAPSKNGPLKQSAATPAPARIDARLKSAAPPTIEVPAMPDPASPIAEADPEPKAGPLPNRKPQPLLGDARPRTLDSSTAPASPLRSVAAPVPLSAPAKKSSAPPTSRPAEPIMVTIPPLPMPSARPLETSPDAAAAGRQSAGAAPVSRSMGRRVADDKSANQIQPSAPSGKIVTPITTRTRVARSELSDQDAGTRATSRPRPEAKTTYRTAPGYRIVGVPKSKTLPAPRKSGRAFPATGPAGAAAPSAITVPARTQRFVQLASRSGFRGNLTAAPERQVLGAFDLLVSGRQVTIKDGDGSIYNGSSQPGGSADGFKFTVKGRHRSTNQRVEFAGTYGSGIGRGQPPADASRPGSERAAGPVAIEGRLTLNGKIRSQISAVNRP